MILYDHHREKRSIIDDKIISPEHQFENPAKQSSVMVG